MIEAVVGGLLVGFLVGRRKGRSEALAGTGTYRTQPSRGPYGGSDDFDDDDDGIALNRR